eukprot:TRINITY_DN5218_c0_g1_i1.p1 TRINITY_DN5218_c0_g1~~TRINITY_DN5218_c0_g1_i1.p1  ORF type:complete len:122 (-),score=34.39 TRINITY_DN5218_c0_g1_i1:59-424(-)
MIRRPPRSTLSSSSAASDVYKRQVFTLLLLEATARWEAGDAQFTYWSLASSISWGVLWLDLAPGTNQEFSSSASIAVRTLSKPVSYTHLRAHETPEHLVCRLLLEKKKKKKNKKQIQLHIR